MSTAEWHKSKMENPVYRPNIRYGIVFVLGMTPLIWTMVLGYGSAYCVIKALRTGYGPRIGNDGMASGIVLLPAAAILSFRGFWILFRKSRRAALWVAAVTNLSFVAAAICSTSPKIISAL